MFDLELDHWVLPVYVLEYLLSFIFVDGQDERIVDISSVKSKSKIGCEGGFFEGIHEEDG